MYCTMNKCIWSTIIYVILMAEATVGSSNQKVFCIAHDVFLLSQMTVIDKTYQWNFPTKGMIAYTCIHGCFMNEGNITIFIIKHIILICQTNRKMSFSLDQVQCVCIFTGPEPSLSLWSEHTDLHTRKMSLANVNGPSPARPCDGQIHIQRPTKTNASM